MALPSLAIWNGTICSVACSPLMPTLSGNTSGDDTKGDEEAEYPGEDVEHICGTCQAKSMGQSNIIYNGWHATHLDELVQRGEQCHSYG